MTSIALGAVDIGNSGLRVMLGRLANDVLTVEEIVRHPNAPYLSNEGWRWNATQLRDGLLDGLRAADEREKLACIGVDTWGVDYALLDPTRSLLDDPFSYRDQRSIPMVEIARQMISSEHLYALTGCQEIPINTLYQLLADRQSGRLDQVSAFLMINDLCTWWLTGEIVADETNASTTGLFDPRARNWCWPAIDALGFQRNLFAPVTRTGTMVGETSSDCGIRAGIPIATVGGHDTAVAFVAGADSEDALVISIGTWSLVGVELDTPLITVETRRANFTNEIGVLGTIRFLRNAAGMWMLQECMREWREDDPNLTWEQIIAEAESSSAFTSLFDPDHDVFMAPGRMEDRVRSSGDGHLGLGRGPVVRSTIESLALNHRWLLETTQSLLHRELRQIRIVGGGSRNSLVCQMTANATGRDVLAGPAEATAIGNLAMQSIALGQISDLEAARSVIRRSFPQQRYTPHGQRDWERAYQRWLGMVSR